MPSIFRSNLFLATALALGSHSYVRRRLLDDTETADAGMDWMHPISAYYDSTLPLFITAETVVRLLHSIKVPHGISITMKETSVEHVEELKERLQVIEGALKEPRRIRSNRAWELQREMLLETLMKDIMRRRLLTRWEVVVTRRCVV